MTERSSVQNPMLRYAEQIGWRYVSPPEALRLRAMMPASTSRTS